MATATLKWTLPTTRVDGSPLNLDDVGFVDVFDNAVAGPPIAQLPGPAQEFTTDVLSPGAHAFTVVVQDTGGRRSEPSNVASVDAPEVSPPPPAEAANPVAVSDLSATLNPGVG